MERGVSIPWDLEGTPLQIRTDSAVGSDDYILIVTDVGIIGVKFDDSIEYAINSCTSNWRDLPVQPPVEVDKIWTINKTETAFIITCNGVEVLNYLFADSSKTSCATTWGGDVVENIEFKSTETASDFYREGN